MCRSFLLGDYLNVVMVNFSICYALLKSIVFYLRRVVYLRVMSRWHIVTLAQMRWTALIKAAEKGRSDCARLLLDAGADLNAKDLVRMSVGSFDA
jgi:hypothetical protein